MTKIVSTLNLKIPPRDLKSKDGRSLLSLIFSQWLSLSTCVIQAIVDVVPPPSVAQRTRIPKMLYPDLYDATVEPKSTVEENLFSCDKTEGACVVALVSKMFAVPDRELPKNKKAPLTADEMRRRAREAKEAREAAAAAAQASDSASLNDAPAKLDVKDRSASGTPAPSEPEKGAEKEGETEGETILGFARIYSGTIKVGTTISCVLPKFHNSLPADHLRNVPHVVSAPVEALYTMMGRELVPVDSVSAGNVFAIEGLEGKVWRSATLCAPDEKGVRIAEGEAQADAKGHLINLGGFTRSVSGVL